VSSKKKVPAESEAVQQARAVAGLSEGCVRMSAALRARHVTDTGAVQQPERDLIRAYAQARRLAEGFAERLAAAQWPAAAVSQTRPNGVKSLERIVEKYLYSQNALQVPLDMLAGKIVVTSLWNLYDVALHVAQVFPVVGYRDRVVRPQASGYRDLQFILNVDGHYAELKVMHRFIDELDAYEHRLYEIRRSLKARALEVETGVVQTLVSLEPAPVTEAAALSTDSLSPIERLVLDTLDSTSADLFKHAWTLVMAAEQPGRI
jgi:hypothetical protein